MEEKMIDIEIAKMVFGDNEEMYKKYLFQFIDRDLFGQMEEFLKDGDVKNAFTVAHTMKGLVQNLALTDFSRDIEAVVEIMRDDTLPTDEQLVSLRDNYAKLVRFLEEVREKNIALLK